LPNASTALRLAYPDQAAAFDAIKDAVSERVTGLPWPKVLGLEPVPAARKVAAYRDRSGQLERQWRAWEQLSALSEEDAAQDRDGDRRS
jgi:hypothetical protein